MAKKIGLLDRQERKRASKLIAAKLDKLGVKDMITMKPTRIMKSFVDENGKEMFRGQMQIAQNVHRNLIKKVRRMPKAMIERFLQAQIEVAKK